MTFIDVRRRSFLSGEIMNAAQIRQLRQRRYGEKPMRKIVSI